MGTKPRAKTASMVATSEKTAATSSREIHGGRVDASLEVVTTVPATATVFVVVRNTVVVTGSVDRSIVVRTVFVLVVA